LAHCAFLLKKEVSQPAPPFQGFLVFFDLSQGFTLGFAIPPFQGFYWFCTTARAEIPEKCRNSRDGSPDPSDVMNQYLYSFLPE
jgi:hypothetical protein